MAQAFENPELDAQLNANGADPVAVADAAGFSITAEEFRNAVLSWENWRMTAIHDEEF